MSNNLDLKDLMSAELFLWIYGPTIISRIIVWLPCEHSRTRTKHLFIISIMFLELFSIFLNQRENRWTIVKTGQLVEFFHGNLFKVPKLRYPSHANSRDKESLNSSTQANPSQRSSLRSSLRSSTGKVQECSLTPVIT